MGGIRRPQSGLLTNTVAGGYQPSDTFFIKAPGINNPGLPEGVASGVLNPGYSPTPYQAVINRTYICLWIIQFSLSLICNLSIKQV